MTRARQVLIRTEGGRAIGFGHVRRCLTLAQALRRKAAVVTFLVGEDPVIREQIGTSGFVAEPIAMERDPYETVRWCDRLQAEVVVVDSYRFPARWLEALAPKKRLVVTIDDHGDGEFPAEVVVVHCAPGAERLPPARARTFAGPCYALLRPEFAQPVERRLSREVTRVLIMLGGGDPHGLTPRLIEWTRRTLGPVQIDVVIGPLCDEKMVGGLNGRHPGITYHRQPSHIRDLMLAADLAVSGGGQTTYELAATGTPAIAIRLAENQTNTLQGFAEAGALLWAGDVSDPDLEGRLIEMLTRLTQDSARRITMSATGRRLVDGRGATRVARGIVEQVEQAAVAGS